MKAGEERPHLKIFQLWSGSPVGRGHGLQSPAPSWFAAVPVPRILISSQLLNSFWKEKKKNNRRGSQFHTHWRGAFHFFPEWREGEGVGRRSGEGGRGGGGQQRYQGSMQSESLGILFASGTERPPRGPRLQHVPSRRKATTFNLIFKIFNNRIAKGSGQCVYSGLEFFGKPPARV